MERPDTLMPGPCWIILFVMHRPPQRWILWLLALSLAVLPLRAVLAMPVFMPAGDMSHCARMQRAAQDRHGLAMPDREAHGNAPCPCCNQGCGGHHCNQLCPGCLPAVGVIDNHLLFAAFDRFRDCPVPLAERYSDRTTRPLYRPPIRHS